MKVEMLRKIQLYAITLVLTPSGNKKAQLSAAAHSLTNVGRVVTITGQSFPIQHSGIYKPLGLENDTTRAEY